MSKVWAGKKRPPNVEALEAFISLSELHLDVKKDELIIGKGQEILKPVMLSIATDGPIFMIISMASGLGKTTALRTWITQLAKNFNKEQLKLVLIDYHSRTLKQFSDLPHIVMINKKENIRSHVTRKSDLKELISWLKDEVKIRREKLEKQFSASPETFDEEKLIDDLGYLFVAIDDYEAFYSSNSSVDIQNLTATIIDGEEVGLRLILSENYALMTNDELMRRAKKYGCGLLLGGSDGLIVFNDSRPPHGQKTSNLPCGRGYLVKRGQAELIQSAVYWDIDENPQQSLNKLMK